MNTWIFAFAYGWKTVDHHRCWRGSSTVLAYSKVQYSTVPCCVFVLHVHCSTEKTQQIIIKRESSSLLFQRAINKLCWLPKGKIKTQYKFIFHFFKLLLFILASGSLIAHWHHSRRWCPRAFRVSPLPVLAQSFAGPIKKYIRHERRIIFDDNQQRNSRHNQTPPPPHTHPPRHRHDRTNASFCGDHRRSFVQNARLAWEGVRQNCRFDSNRVWKVFWGESERRGGEELRRWWREEEVGRRLEWMVLCCGGSFWQLRHSPDEDLYVSI